MDAAGIDGSRRDQYSLGISMYPGIDSIRLGGEAFLNLEKASVSEMGCCGPCGGEVCPLKDHIYSYLYFMRGGSFDRPTKETRLIVERPTVIVL